MIATIYRWAQTREGHTAALTACAFMAVVTCFMAVERDAVPPDSWPDVWALGIFGIWVRWLLGSWVKYKRLYLED